MVQRTLGCWLADRRPVHNPPDRDADGVPQFERVQRGAEQPLLDLPQVTRDLRLFAGRRYHAREGERVHRVEVGLAVSGAQ